MDRIHDMVQIDEERRHVRVHAGARWWELEQLLAESGLTTGQFFPSGSSTVGGAVALNALSWRALGYGSLSQNLFQIRGLTPTGPLSLEAPVPGKPDTRGIMLGSEGRWGITTEVTLRLFPRPPHPTYLLASLPEHDAALATLQNLLEANLGLVSARLIPNALLSLFTIKTTSRLSQLMRTVRGESQWPTHLVLELAGSREQQSNARATLVKILQEAGGQLVTNGTSPWSSRGWYRQQEELLPQLWPRRILGHRVTTVLPWHQVATGLNDWEESLTSVLQTTGYPGLVLTEVEALSDYALFRTLLLGFQAGETIEEQGAQLAQIDAVVKANRARWNLESRFSPLLQRVASALDETLDPLEVIFR